MEKPWKSDKKTSEAAARFTKILEQELAKLKALPAPPDAIRAQLDAYVADLKPYVDSLADIDAFAAKGALATIDWTTTRDPNVPDLYTLTGIFETGLGAQRQHELTTNAAVSFYRSTPTGGTRSFKNFALTGQYDRALGKFRQTALTVTLAARYEYIPNDIVVPVVSTNDNQPAATTPTATAPKGHLGLFQAKLTFPVKGSGIKVPISVTVANRSELIKEKDVRANVGITVDVDTLVGLAFGK